MAPGLLSLLVFSACATGPGVRSLTPPDLDRPFVAGYDVYWTPGAWPDYPLDVLDELFAFEIEVGADGGIRDAHGWPDRWSAAMAAAKAAGIQIVPTISLHEADAFEALFADAAAQGRLVENLMALLAATPGLAGLHLDVEVFRPVEAAARDGYTAFVAGLARRIRTDHPGLSLSVFVLAFDDDDVYNERALGQIADFVVVQGYDYHSMGSPNAGPVGAVRGWGRLSWESVLGRFDDFGVPRDRIVMSVPLYGYEWPVVSEEPGAEASGPAITVPYTAPEEVLPGSPRAREQGEVHGVRRDPVSGSPYYVFPSGDAWRQGWYEDAESLRLKLAFVRENGLGGIALFPLAYGAEEIWEELRRAFPAR